MYKMSLVASAKKALSQGNFRWKFVCYIFMKLGYSNKKMMDLQVRLKVYKFLEKKYIVKKQNWHTNETIGKRKDTIWICWLQGVDQAPEIVQKCIDSIYHFMSDMKINIITAANLHNWVDLPDYIIKKWEKGIITNTAFSDIVRTKILIEYGGVWVDATVFLTGRIPNIILDSDLFVFEQNNWGDIGITFNSWLISANKDNFILTVVYEYLCSYWKAENKIREYFLWHLFFTITLNDYPEARRQICKIPDANSELLFRCIFEKYDSNYFSEITKITNIHKLSYKFTLPIEVEGTYYDYIINGGIHFD